MQHNVLHHYCFLCCPEERWDDFEGLFTAQWHTLISIVSACGNVMLLQWALKAVITFSIYTCVHHRDLFLQFFLGWLKTYFFTLAVFCDAHVCINHWQRSVNVSYLGHIVLEMVAILETGHHLSDARMGRINTVIIYKYLDWW